MADVTGAQPSHHRRPPQGESREQEAPGAAGQEALFEWPPAASGPRAPGTGTGEARAAQTADSASPETSLGYRGTVACAAAGVSYRQLDYWARTDLVAPSVRAAQGSGSQRLYSFRDILVLRVVKRLLEAGVSLHNIRAAIAALRARGVADLAEITLISDGATVYECTSAEEVVDLLQGGQAVFGIAVGRVVDQMRGELTSIPGEVLAEPGPTGADELSRRRRSRSSA